MISILKILLGNKNISFLKSVCFILILISGPLLFSQRIFLDNSIENKNQLFELFGVKKQIIQYKKIQLNDSILSGYSFQTLLIDSSGYVIKKESFNSWSNPPKSVLEFERDKNGNIIQIFKHGELKETRVYNEMNRVKRWDSYWNDNLNYTGIHEYDSLGNESQYLYQSNSGIPHTRLAVNYKYDNKHSLLIEKTSTYFEGGRETTYFKYDSTGRIIKEFTIYTDKNLDDSTLYFYDDINLKDSAIEYYNGHILKTVKEYDKNRKPLKLAFYNEADSLLELDIFEYDNKGMEIRDSIFIANDIEIPQKPYDEMMGEKIVSRMIVNGKISFTTTTSYYPNGLLKQMIKTDYDQNRIEETSYEYEFY